MTRNLFHSGVLRDWMCLWLLSHGTIYSALNTTSNPKRIARCRTAFPTVRSHCSWHPLASLHTIQSAKASLAAAQCLSLSPWYSQQLVKELFLHCFYKDNNQVVIALFSVQIWVTLLAASKQVFNLSESQGVGA